MKNKWESIKERMRELVDFRKAQIEDEEKEENERRKRKEDRIEMICEEVSNIEKKYATRDIYNFLNTFGEFYKLGTETYEARPTVFLENTLRFGDVYGKGIELKAPYLLYLVCDVEPSVKLCDKNDNSLIYLDGKGRPHDNCHEAYGFWKSVKNGKIHSGEITESVEKGIEELIKKAEKSI